MVVLGYEESERVGTTYRRRGDEELFVRCTDLIKSAGTEGVTRSFILQKLRIKAIHLDAMLIALGPKVTVTQTSTPGRSSHNVRWIESETTPPNV
jgi:hypothetical protein